MSTTIEIAVLEDHTGGERKHCRSRLRSPKRRSRFVPLNGKEKSEPRFQIEPVNPMSAGDSPKSAMRVLLQNTKTLKFFGTDEQWTFNAKQARDFGSGWWATLNAFAMDPSHLVIHYEFGDDRYDLQISVLRHSET